MREVLPISAGDRAFLVHHQPHEPCHRRSAWTRRGHPIR
jgi:hypothetical protein